MYSSTGSPLNCRTPPLLGANGHTTLYSTHVHRYASCAPARLRSPSPFFRPVPCSPSGRFQTASAVVSDVSSSAVASTPLRPRLVPPRASTARPGSPRARTAALGRVASPPREVGPALPGRRVSRPHPRPLYRPRLAPPLRWPLIELGKAWPSLSQIPVVRLPPRRAYPW